MAVGAAVGTLGLLWIKAGVWTPAGWPTGTAVGHTVICRCSKFTLGGALGPRANGWTPGPADLWVRKLDAAALAEGPGVWDGQLVGMVTIPGARGIGRDTTDRGVKLAEAGSGMLVYGWSDRWGDDDIDGPVSGMLGTSIEIRDEQWVAWWFRTYPAAGTYRIERDEDAAGYRAFEILPAKAPDPPKITTPGQGAHLDVAHGVSVSVVHQSVSGLPQEARRTRVKTTSSGTWSHVRGDGTLDAAVQTITTSSVEVDIDAGQLAAGGWEVQAATMDGGNWSEWSPSTMFVLEAEPTVVPTLATTFGRLTASASWVPTTPGGVQTAWRAAVVPAGESVADSINGEPVWHQGAGTAWTVPALPWVKGGSYELLLQIEQTGGLGSGWVRSAAATVDWTAPAAPAAIVGVDSVPFGLVVTGVPASAVALSVEWASAHADDWTPLAMVDGPSSSTQIEVALAPYGTPRRYRARAWAAIDGVWLPSGWVTSAAAVSTDEHARLVDVDDPTDWLAVTVEDDDGWTVEQGITVTYPLMPDDDDGAEARPSIDRMPPAGRAGTLGLLCASESDVDQVVEWVTRRKRRWVVRWSPEHDVSRTMRDRTPTVMGLADRVEVGRPIKRRLSVRTITIPWVEQ